MHRIRIFFKDQIKKKFPQGQILFKKIFQKNENNIFQYYNALKGIQNRNVQEECFRVVQTLFYAFFKSRAAFFCFLLFDRPEIEAPILKKLYIHHL